MKELFFTVSRVGFLLSMELSFWRRFQPLHGFGHKIAEASRTAYNAGCCKRCTERTESLGRGALLHETCRSDQGLWHEEFVLSKRQLYVAISKHAFVRLFEIQYTEAGSPCCQQGPNTLQCLSFSDLPTRLRTPTPSTWSCHFTLVTSWGLSLQHFWGGVT